jgi:hypothetical protein
MQKWKLVIGVVLVFALGAAVGSLATGLYMKRTRVSPPRHDPEARKAFIMEKLSRELNLSELQRSRIAAVVDQLQEKRQEHFRRTRSTLKEIMDEGFLLMKKELSPVQQKKFDEMRKRFEKRRREREARHLRR